MSTCKHHFRKELLALMSRLVVAVERIANPTHQPFSILGGDVMFELPNDHADVPFTISAVSATDSEGETITLTESLTTSDEGVVSILFAEGSDASSPRAGQVHIGHSGLASLEYTAKDPSGNIVKSGGAQFTITTGAIANVSGGDLALEGIAEV